MSSPWLASIVLLCCAAAQAASEPAPAGTAASDTDRAQTYKAFRSLFDVRQYERALPLAQQLVIATEQQYGEKDRALVNPLCNLGTTHYRLKNYAEAVKSYERGIAILDQAGGGADRQLLRPLLGAGLAYQGLKNDVDAALALKRAVDLSRNLDGLFNIEQLQYLQPLIASYSALGSNTEADKEYQYSLRVAEDAYGRSDTRMLAPIDIYARWLEERGRYGSARALHQHALDIAQQSGGRDSVLTVTPLEGIARTHRLEFLNGGEPGGDKEDAFTTPSADLRSSMTVERLNPDGEKMLQLALAALDKSEPPDHRRRGEALVELGDWYISSGDGAKALETYGAAWKELAQADATAPLEQPMLIAYRPPSTSVKRSTLDPEIAVQNFVEMGFTVTRAGRVENPRVVESNAPEGLRKTVENAVKKARYRPRFESGEAVDTADVRLREELLLKPKK